MFIEDKNNPTTIKMVEGDYGITLPIELDTDETITSADCFEVCIYKELNANPLITKSYSDISNNTIEFSLSISDSALLPVGTYYYDINWYQGSAFMSCIAPKKKLVVVEKAGAVSDDED